MVNDMFGIRLLYPSNKTNFQYYAFPRRKSQAETSLREHVISRGVFSFFTNPAFNDSDVIYSMTYSEIWEQLQTQYINEEEFRSVENPINASLQIYSNEFHYDPSFGGAGGVAVDPQCEQDHQESHQQGFSRTAQEYRNVEITSYIFIDELADREGFLYFEARSNNNHPGWDSQCCSDHGYGVRLYPSERSDFKGKVAFYKRTFSGGQKVLPKISQTPSVVIESFYQQAIGVKFCIYNPDPNTNERVHLELWLTAVDWSDPSSDASNQWTKVAEVEDYVGKAWTNFGKECGAEHDDQPITWAAPFVGFGWRKIRSAKFMYTSFREIDITGNFGDDPIPPPNPETDPTIPPVDPPPVIEPPPPPDAEPPDTATSMTKRLTIRREIINSSTCVCDGVKPDVPVPPDDGGGGGGGGGGGTATLRPLYFLGLNTSGIARLAKVSGSSSYMLRFGQAVTQTWSEWIGKRIARVEITISKNNNPTGGTGSGVHCRVRRAFDDSIAATLLPVCSETNITRSGIVHVFENLTNSYAMQFNDKLLFEYDGGNSSNYVRVYRVHDSHATGTKVVWQTNADDPGEYHYEAQLDMCMRVLYTEGQISGADHETDYDVTVLKKHVYDVMKAG